MFWLFTKIDYRFVVFGLYGGGYLIELLCKCNEKISSVKIQFTHKPKNFVMFTLSDETISLKRNASESYDTTERKVSFSESPPKKLRPLSAEDLTLSFFLKEHIMKSERSVPLESDRIMNQSQSQLEWLYDKTFKQTVSPLLLALPFACLSHYQEWNASSIFCLNFLAMIPLATILGDFTEELAHHTNQTIGGLINATFGNAVEVVVAIQALLANEIRVVQASMLGSIFSNLLFVLGSCFLFGGLAAQRRNETGQAFNATAATANMSLLSLASIALILPTPFASYYQIADEHVLQVSRVAAIFLFAMYVQLLLFQLITHAKLFEDLDKELATISLSFSLVGLTAVTVLITFLSDWLVTSIDGFVEETGISKTFVGVILLPIVGNAVEHLTAVSVAIKDKMDLSMASKYFCLF